MHLKKLLALGLSLTMAVALLSGCGQQETAEGGTPSEQVIIYSNADEEAITAMTNALNAGGGVHGICAKGAFKPLSRKELDKLTDFIKGIGGKGMAWMRLGEITGQTVGEEIIDRIFNKFCLGK